MTVPWELVDSVSVRERNIKSSRRSAVAEDDGRPVLHVVIGSRTNVGVRLSRPLAVAVRGTVHDVREVRLFADDPPHPGRCRPDPGDAGSGTHRLTARDRLPGGVIGQALTGALR